MCWCFCTWISPENSLKPNFSSSKAHDRRLRYRRVRAQSQCHTRRGIDTTCGQCIYIYIRSKTTHNHVGILHCHRIISTDDDNNNSVYIIYLYDDAHDPTARARSVHAGYTFCILLTAFIYLTTSVYRYLVPNYLHTTTGNSCPALRYGI